MKKRIPAGHPLTNLYLAKMMGQGFMYRMTSYRKISDDLLRLRGFVFRDARTKLVGIQMLEKDICVQGWSMSDALKNLRYALSAEIHISEELGQIPFEHLAQAPKEFWDVYENMGK